MPISLILITRDVATARHAIGVGVDRIMVDLEHIGKHERQGHLDTLISAHTLDDVSAVASAIGGSQLVVRTNDLHPDLPSELDDVLRSEPTAVMLPMVRTVGQVNEFARMVDGRARIIVLVETAEGMSNFSDIARLAAVDELYIGLNDLHMDLGSKFMFEPLANGMVERAMAIANAEGKPCGFGGIARMHEGVIPGHLILGEHVRLRSSGVILSRTFHRRLSDTSSLTEDNEFDQEVALLRRTETELKSLSERELLKRSEKFRCAVDGIIG